MAVGALLSGAVGGAGVQAIFGGFAPFPNSIMIPFMGAQSAVLAYNFGIYYELGKRTVKSLDNDFFNKIRAGSSDEISVIWNGKEIKMKYNEYISFLTKQNSTQMITDFRNVIPDFQNLQNDIIEQTVQIELKKAMRTPSAMTEIILAFANASDIEINKQYTKYNDIINEWHKQIFGGETTQVGTIESPEEVPTVEPIGTPTESTPTPIQPIPDIEPLPVSEVPSYKISFNYQSWNQTKLAFSTKTFAGEYTEETMKKVLKTYEDAIPNLKFEGYQQTYIEIIYKIRQQWNIATGKWI